MKTVNYKISVNDLIITDGFLRAEETLVLNDKERVISQEEMFQGKFDIVYEVFLRKLKNLKNLKCQISQKEEKRLVEMLKDLIIANKNIYRNRGC